jgi:hypothetical protein
LRRWAGDWPGGLGGKIRPVLSFTQKALMIKCLAFFENRVPPAFKIGGNSSPQIFPFFLFFVVCAFFTGAKQKSTFCSNGAGFSDFYNFSPARKKRDSKFANP